MRGTLARVNDKSGLQTMQVTRLEGETFDDCERIGQYGLTSVPPSGSEVLIGQVGSNADHTVILGVDDSSRPHPLTDGQTCLYDKSGTQILLNGDGSISITCAGGVTINGNLSISGNVTIGGTLNGHAP